jgi:hypothetical protein
VERWGYEMNKLRSIVWCLVTVILAMVGISGYSSGEYTMTFFGIHLSKGGFIVLIIVFLITDVLALYNAFTSDKRKDEEQQKKLEEFHQNVQNEQLPAPCLVYVTRESKVLGAAIAFNVYLNYMKAGVLKNGQTIQFYASLKNNVLTGDSSNGQVREPFCFEAAPGGTLYINYNSTKNQFEWGNNVNV